LKVSLKRSRKGLHISYTVNFATFKHVIVFHFSTYSLRILCHVKEKDCVNDGGHRQRINITESNIQKKQRNAKQLIGDNSYTARHKQIFPIVYETKIMYIDYIYLQPDINYQLYTIIVYVYNEKVLI
jgi:hypothetical protein